MNRTITIRHPSLVFQVDEGGEGVKIPPGMACFARDEVGEESTSWTFEELESAFLTWWDVPLTRVLGPVWWALRPESTPPEPRQECSPSSPQN